MAFPDVTQLAAVTYLAVGTVVVILGVLSLRSYRATGNPKLLFVVMAFFVLALKSLFVVANEFSPTHPVGHHIEVVVMGFFDVIAVVLLFIPFVTPKSG